MRRPLSVLMIPALLLILGQSALAAPTPPLLVANHETQKRVSPGASCSLHHSIH